MTTTSLPGGLGRLPAEDQNDKRFPMMAAVDAAAQMSEVDRIIRYHYSDGFWGDQGPTPQCVGFSCTHLVEDGPVTRPESRQGTSIIDPSELYREAQKLDEWEGENYDGTSVRAGMKVLKARGFISEYRWAWNGEEVIQALLHYGPVVVGTWWYNDMFFPDHNGYVKPIGKLVGGHAYILNGVNTKTRIVRAKNSWGRSWGKRGFFYLSFDTLNQLIAADGEAAIATEIPLAL